jgi:hypothetical protein
MLVIYAVDVNYWIGWEGPAPDWLAVSQYPGQMWDDPRRGLIGN